MMINLKSRIQNRQSTIAIIGLGYVGLPLAIRFSEEGFKTIGFDIDKEKVDLLNNGKSYIKHIKEYNIAAMANNGFTATMDFGKILYSLLSSKISLNVRLDTSCMNLMGLPDQPQLWQKRYSFSVIKYRRLFFPQLLPSLQIGQPP